MSRRRLPTILVAPLFFVSLAAAPAGAVSPDAVELRDRGVALLENEQPAEAEPLFRELTTKVPGDPLAWANLAVTQLRQQRNEEALASIGEALKRAPDRSDLLLIRGEILQWAGKPQESLAVLRGAAEAAPRDLEAQYTLLRQATTAGDEAAQGEAIDRLAKLRPDNLVVLLRRGQRAIAQGDRETASEAFLRVRELSWQAPPITERVLEPLIEALEAGDLEKARVPALRLENVLKVTPMFQQGLRELTLGIQGVPVTRFVDEPERKAFGDPVPVTFHGSTIDEAAATAGPVVADLDGDETPDVAWLVAGGLRVALGGGEPAASPAPTGLVELTSFDLNNDGLLDLVAWGASSVAVWSGTGGGAFEPAAEAFGLAGTGATAGAALDFDIEGDLDLFLAGGESGSGALWRNALAGPLESVGERVLAEVDLRAPRQAVASDLDRDGDLDMLVAHGDGLAWFDNLRQGEMADRTVAGGLGRIGSARGVESADLDGDGWPDLAVADGGLSLLRNDGGTFSSWAVDGLDAAGGVERVIAFDVDNDGRLDLAGTGGDGVRVLRRRGDGFESLTVEGGGDATGLAAGDLDGDGDLDLVVAGPGGVVRLENRGGDANRALTVSLRGLAKGNSKNNIFGLGSTLELIDGSAYQFREARGDVTHFGLGKRPSAEMLRVVWTNGVPQNRFDARATERIVEEQVLKGSCPFVYTWNGREVAFVTDLLWNAPLGLPVAPGVFAGADPSELVLVTGAETRNGIYDLRVTEELWEAAFFDHVRLWVVDHPAEVEVASNLRVLPGRSLPEEVHGTRDLRPLAAALDASGRNVTERVARRDEVYADGWRPSRYQGVAEEPWSFTLDLGASPAKPVRLLLDGWIFPADASLNLAVAQRGDLAARPSRLEMETADGWTTLVAEMGFPAGKTKTMVFDTPPLPPGVSRLRIVSGQWLSWDRIVWSAAPADDEPVVVAQLAPATADLRFRGFSGLVRHAPNAPHAYDYARTTAESPWLPFPGRYTRYGDVRELLSSPDDRSVILAPGDEIALTFDAEGLPPVAPGWRRTVFLESHGWDKDADRNTGEGLQVGPLPFRAMSGYPYGPDESFPDTELHRRYVEEWLTRRVAGQPQPPHRVAP